MVNKKVLQPSPEMVMVGSGFILPRQESPGPADVVPVDQRNQVEITEERNAEHWLCSQYQTLY